MKAALNGALNLSILDGWWAEWFDGQNGWAIPTADGVEDPDRRDDIEARGLYDLIEHKVAPTFYSVDHERIPRRWVEMMRHTLITLGPKVLATRMVRDYVTTLYQPAAVASRLASAEDYGRARELADFKARIIEAWPGVRVEHVETDGVGDSPTVGMRVTVRAYIALGDVCREDVRVEAIYGRVDSEDDIERSGVVELLSVESYDGNRWRYEARIELDRSGPFGLTVRVLPVHAGLASPIELGLQAVPVR
jgi:starch phosphorylase